MGTRNSGAKGTGKRGVVELLLKFGWLQTQMQNNQGDCEYFDFCFVLFCLFSERRLYVNFNEVVVQLTFLNNCS